MKFKSLICKFLVTTISFSQITLATDGGGGGGGKEPLPTEQMTRDFFTTDSFTVVSQNFAGPNNSFLEYMNPLNERLSHQVLKTWEKFARFPLKSFIEAKADQVFSNQIAESENARIGRIVSMLIAKGHAGLPISNIELVAKALEQTPKDRVLGRLNDLLSRREIASVTVGDLFYLAASSKLRIISAADRVSRPVATKDTGDSARISPWQISLPSYLEAVDAGIAKTGMKYSKETEISANLAAGLKLSPVLAAERFLSEVPIDKLPYAAQLETIRTLHDNAQGRLLQLVIYDMIVALSLQEIATDFSSLYRDFSLERSAQIKGMIKNYAKRCDLILAQEVSQNFIPKGFKGSVCFEEEAKVESAQSSAVFAPEGKAITLERDVTLEIEALLAIGGCDFVATKLTQEGQSILALSIHTPSKGGKTIEIIEKVRAYFNDQAEFDHLLIAIDANTKSETQRADLYDTAKAGPLPLKFTYFPSEDKAEFIRLTGSVYDPTSQGTRTFVQSQVGQGHSPKVFYVDYILYASKPTASKNLLCTALISPSSSIVTINPHNWADHLPRAATCHFINK